MSQIKVIIGKFIALFMLKEFKVCIISLRFSLNSILMKYLIVKIMAVLINLIMELFIKIMVIKLHFRQKINFINQKFIIHY